MIKILDESRKVNENDPLYAEVYKYLNYHLPEGAESATIDDLHIDEDEFVEVDYHVRFNYPVYTDPETGIVEYEPEDDYRSDSFYIDDIR